MVKKKALGQDPFSGKVFPWIKSTEEEKGEGITQAQIPQAQTTQTQTIEKPSKQSLQSKQGIQSNPETLRQTYHLDVDNVEKIKQYAYIERLKISEVVNRALEDFFKKNKFTL